jgi:hypothetical protein
MKWTETGWRTASLGRQNRHCDVSPVDQPDWAITARPRFVVVVGGAPTSMGANAARAAWRRPMQPAVQPPGVRVVTRTHPG